MQKEIYDTIEREYRAAVKAAENHVLKCLEVNGIKPGALVQSNWNARVYEAKRIDFSACVGFLYGTQRRQDGTFGTALHSIGTPDGVTVVQ